LPDNFLIKLGEESLVNLPIISRKIKDDMYLLSFKKKHPKMHFLWWLFADCGRSLLRWALWSILFAVFFAYVFFSMGPEAFTINSKLPYSGITMLYYSVVTFTTLGFGDVIPNTVTAGMIVMLEVILGYIMLGGLISILANKLARRS
jgi:voltage-gated potassium channel Kch